MKAMNRFFSTDRHSWSLLIVRLTIGFVLLPHGMQKALGLFGGYGFTGTLGFFTGTMGIPVIIAVLVILAEFVGSLGLIFGVGTRFMAFSVFTVMLGAMILGGHIYNGFFMNWFGNQKGEGMEYFILMLGMALALMIGGSGKLAIDNLISKRLR